MDSTFEEELLAFGVSLEELEAALEGVMDELWGEFDSQMEELWFDQSERDRAEASFDVPSLYEAAPTVAGGVVRLSLDLEADLAAEPLSHRVDAPILAARRYGAEWCRLVLFKRGRARAWLFWASDEWADEFDGEIEPALAGAARANGGWVGDPAPFSELLDGEFRLGDLRRLLKSRAPDAEVFVNEFYRLCGAPAMN